MANISNGANLGFENQLWAAADKLRGHMDASEYMHVVLGLIFLKYISDENIFWVPPEARCIVKLLVRMIEPFKGRIFDPC